jgi:hypothetical protein
MYPNFVSFHYFHLGPTIEYIKELRGASIINDYVFALGVVCGVKIKRTSK